MIKLDFAVNASELTKVFDKKITAVDHINFKVKLGEIYGILGPNGAGKTTTIRMLTTFLKPSSGNLNVLGYNVNTEAVMIRENIGYSTQDGGLDENATARENLMLFGHYYHLKKPILQNRVNELLKFVKLEGFANKLIKFYSGGMRKRLEIATSLIHQPKLLILDEPTLGLDIQTRTHIWGYLRSLAKQGITIIITTHYLEEADQICDEIAIIDHGKIIASGIPDELKKRVGEDMISLTFSSQKCSQLVDIITHAKELLANDAIIISIHQTSKGLNIFVRDGITSFQKVFSILTKLGIKIEQVSFSKPSLDDVFLMYTGRTMREKKGSPTNLFKNLRTRGGA